MKLQNMTIEFSSALLDIAEVNPSFDIGKLRVAYTGKNRNNTYISKDSFERAVPTMFNCPVVANYIRKQDEIGSHDGEFVKNKDGEVKYVNITQPVGLVPESAQWYWEDVNDNGVLHQYFCTEIVLWKRQEAYEKIKENGVTKQSMEIEVTNGEMLDDYYDIKDFCFTAFCLLGTAEPCFESAALFTFAEQEDFKAQYTEMLKEFKLAFADTSNNEKEGKENLKLKELLEKYSVSQDELEFEVEELSDEELEAKFVEVYEAVEELEADPADPEDDPADDPEDDPADDPEDDPTDEFALNSQLRDNLFAIVRQEKISDDWGEYSRRWPVDFDVEAQEVYYYDEMDGKLYGCSYVVDGDDVAIDFENQKRKKYTIVDYVEGSFDGISEVFELIKTFGETYSKDINIDVAEFERLKTFEADILAAKRETAEKALFDKFEEKLKDNEEFKALKKKASEYELDALEKELFALVGKVDFTFSFKKMGETNNSNKPAPMIGFEAAVAANKSNDELVMTNFMERYLK